MTAFWHGVNDLIEFLTKCNDEDEAAAKEAAFCDGGWFIDQGDPGTVYADHENPWGIVEAGFDLAPHIALHSPVRVLRECAARRRLIGEWRRADADSDPDSQERAWGLEYGLKLSVQSYVDRPGFRDEWLVT